MIFIQPDKQSLQLFPFSFRNITVLVLLLSLLTGYGCKNKPQPVVYGDNAKAGHYAVINGIKIYYEVYGNGEPLVLLHGNGGSIKS